MREQEIITNKKVRINMMDRVEVLDKVKEVILLPYGEVATSKQVAEYYEVGNEAINSIIKRNKEELESNGLRKLKINELENFFESSNCTFKTMRGKTIIQTSDDEINVTNTGLIILTRRAILNVGMLLEQSLVAKEIRNKLLDIADTKEANEIIVNEIDQETMLVMKVYNAKTDIDRLAALSELNTYKDSKLNKVKDELDKATGTIEHITKSDATFGLRVAKNNLGVKERQFTKYLIDNKYLYRQGRLKPYAEFTKEPTRYFTEIVELDRFDNEHKKMVFTIDGIEFFRTKIDDINNYK